MSDIFLSYARQDRDKIDRLAHALESWGWTVFVDRTIPAGGTWRSSIGAALETARCVVVAWSKHSIASRWVCEEAEDGQERNILIPVLLETVRPPLGFRSIQAANLAQWDGSLSSAEFHHLTSSIERIIGPPKRPTKPPTEKTAEPPLPAKSARSWPKINYQLGLRVALGIVLFGIPVWVFILKSDLAPITQQTALEQAKAEQTAKKQAEAKRLTEENAKVAEARRLAEEQAKAEVQRKTEEASQTTSVFQDRLKDGSLGPNMVWLPTGKFSMGDLTGNGNKDELPVHSVTISKPFALGQFEVTFDEYDRFARTTQRTLPDDRGWGRGNRPVIDVTWDDAVAYANWLSVQTGKPYRLPTEAEWEYAARAGTQTEYWWGNNLVKNRANCDSCGSPWDNQQTAPVGSFKANPWGLYDTTGNVWEWVQDCYHASYGGAPNHGSVWQTGACDRGMVRGGSWDTDPANLRSALRFRYTRYFWNSNLGFRLAQDK